MTNRDFSVRSAQDEMRHFVGSSELDVIIVSDQDQNRGCKKNDKNHLKFLCKLCEASRRRAVASSCMSRHQEYIRECVCDADHGHARNTSGLAACDGGGPGFVNASGADGHQCTTSWKSGCKENAHARISMLVLRKARRWNNQEHWNVKLPEQ